MPKSVRKARTASESSGGKFPAGSHPGESCKSSSTADDKQVRKKITGINRPMPLSAKKKLLEKLREEEEESSSKGTDSSLVTASDQPQGTGSSLQTAASKPG